MLTHKVNVPSEQSITLYTNGKMTNTDNAIIFSIKIYQILDSIAEYLGIWM